jgi:hypothetical protein
MVAVLARHDGQLIEHGEAIKELQDGLAPLRRLIEPISARDALRAMDVDNEGLMRQDRGQTTEQAFGAILQKRWSGPGAPMKKMQRMAAERFDKSRHVNAYPRQHIINCWDEFYQMLAPNSVGF